MKQSKIIISFASALISTCMFSQQEIEKTKAKELQEVVIISKKTFIEQTANKISINVSQSPIALASNAYDILLQSPGVIEQNGSLIFRSKSVTVLIDGKLTNLSGEELKIMLNSVSGNAIDKVEILPNPSSKYDALGGSIINIKLSKNRKSGISGSVLTNSKIGKYVSFLPGMTLNYKNKSVNIYSSYNYENSKQYYKNNSNQILSPNSSLLQDENGVVAKDNHNYRLGLDYDINKKNTVGFVFRGMSNNNTLLSNNNINLIDSGNSSISNLNNNNKSKTFNPATNLYYKTVLDSLQRTITVNLDYFEYKKNVNEYFITNYFSIATPDILIRDFTNGNNKIFSAAVDFEYPTSIGNFEFGLKSVNTKSGNDITWENLQNDVWTDDPLKSNNFIYKENINAGYTTYDKALGDHWQITLGIRAEQTHSDSRLIGGAPNSRNYFNLFPNLNLQYLKNLNNIFNFSYRKSIQRFGFDVVNPFIRYQSQYNYFQGNPNIRPQINHGFDLTYTYRQTLTFGASETHSIDPLGPLFTKKGNTTISTYTNFKNSDFFYIYTSWNKEFFKIWTINLVGGTGFYKYNTSTDDYISTTGNNTWAYLIQNNSSFKFKNNWSAQLNMVYQSPIAMGIYKTKAYYNSNLGISKQLLGNKMNLNLVVSDIFNTMRSSYLVDYNNIILNQNKKSETRFVTIGLTYKFGKNSSKPKQSNETFDDLEKRMKTEQQ